MTDAVTPCADDARIARALQTIERLQARLAAAESGLREPLAVLGIGCRYPGGADSPAAFWRLLEEGRDAIGPVPSDRWDADALHDPDPAAPGRIVAREGGFVPDPQAFDAAFFGIAPREAASLDPQQRLLLEVAWEALEDAGLPPPSLAGRPVGVFIGISSNDYSHHLLQLPQEDIDAYLATGNSHSVAAGRLSYHFGFTGPSLAVDTACSSSLVALHLAMRSLRDGECELALVGGVNRILSPAFGINFSRARMLAPDGRCKAFSARADGFGRGEGCGVIVLRCQADAERRGERVRALLRGSAINQDGRSGGLTVPNGPAQQAVIRRALRDAGLAPAELQYVEAHGTGTALGDPIEAAALGAVFAEGRPAGQPLHIGTVKANVGHLEAAAGMCGVIKVVLALQHGRLPAQLHAMPPSPHIAWDTLPLALRATTQPWPAADGPRRAGVSSFGFSGTNAHVVLEAAPARDEVALDAGPDVLLLAARDGVALRALALRHAETLQDGSPWRAHAHAVAHGRAALRERLALVADSGAAAAQRLHAWAAGQGDAGVQVSPVERVRPRIGWLFSGQGAQWPGMGRALYAAEPVFRDAFDSAAERLQIHAGLDLKTLLWADDADAAARLERTEFAQPALFAIGHALAVWWRAAGAAPVAVLGHSVGEIVAAVAAGVLDLDAGARLVAARGRLMQAQPGDGAMAALPLPVAVVQDALQSDGGGAVVAALNAPDSTVIAGPRAVLQRLLAAWRAQGVEGRLLAVSHAFHSPQMAPAARALAATAAGLVHAAPRATLLSSRAAQPLGAATDWPAHWAAQLVEPVRFAAALEALVGLGCTHLIELGPQPQLLALGQRWLQAPTRRWLPSQRRGGDGLTPLLQSLAQLYVDGADVRRPGQRQAAVSLPTYPFQRSRHWVDLPAALPPPRLPQLHPLIGRRLAVAGDAAQHYEVLLDAHTPAWAAEHTVFGHVVLPAAGLAEMVLAAARQAAGARPLALRDLVFRQALRLDAPRRVQLVHRPDGSVEIHGSADEDGAAWVQHASARIAAAPPRPAVSDALAAACAACTRTVEVSACLQRLAAQGVAYGPAFAALRSVACGEGRVLARISLPAGHDAAAYQLHPVLLDAALQSLAAAFIDDAGQASDSGMAWLPAAIEQLVLFAPVGAACWSVATLRRGSDGQALGADIHLLADDGSVLASLDALALRPADAARLRAAPLPLLQLEWVEAPLPPDPTPEPRWSQLCAAADTQLADALAQPQLRDYLAVLPALDAVAARWAAVALAEAGHARPAEPVAAALLHRLQALAATQPAAPQRAAVLAEQQRLRAAHPAAATELDLLQHCALGLPDVLRGTRAPLSLLFDSDRLAQLHALYADSPGAQVANRLAAEAAATWAAGRATLRVLEIGAGTGGSTDAMLGPLRQAVGTLDYHFTDVSPTLLDEARSRYGAALQYWRLDIEQPPAAQGIDGRFDIVIAANVLHATADLRHTLAHVRSLLAPGGLLLLLELTRPMPWLDLIFGLSDGWWRFTDTDLRQHALLPTAGWLALLAEGGWQQPVLLGGADTAFGVFAARAPLAQPLDLQADAVLDADGWAARLAQLAQGPWPEAVSWFVRDDATAAAALLQGVQGLLQAAERRALPAPQLSVVTIGATAAGGDLPQPQAAAAWGLARVVALEHPELRCRRIDLDPLDSDEAQAACLRREAADASAEATVAWRRGQRRVPRLAPATVQPAQDDGDWQWVGAADAPERRLRRVPLLPRAPAAGEVQIRVEAAGINFIDALDALGLLPFDRAALGVGFGAECAGTVLACGPGVEGFAPGDRVIALAPGSWRSQVTVLAAWVAPLPAGLSAAAGAALPAASLTAWHALIEVAGLRAGEQVLVHAAAGGTGRAALEIARLVGAQVHATASPGKWPLLRAAGVAKPMHSRTLAFRDELLAASPGGVDVVLNSLGDEFIAASLDCLKPGGRFIEIGKRDGWHAERVRALRPDLRYERVDLMALAQSEPARIRALFDALGAAWRSGRLPALPYRSFGFAQADEALRLMQRGGHAGKLVLQVEAAAQVRADASYLVTGGFGGLGLATAAWLVGHGARHIALLGREARPDALPPAWRAAGVQLLCLEADVTDAAALTAALARIDATLPPLGGVFHAAGRLDDGVLRTLPRARFDAVLAPKLAGAWFLHRLTQQRPLDWFVLYSSAAALFGSPGQAAHVAANSGLDALAVHRRALGLAATSVQWGPWSHIGAAADAATLSALRARGIEAISPDEGHALLDSLLLGLPPAVVGAVKIDPARLAAGAQAEPLFARFAPPAAATAAGAAADAADELAGLATLPPPQRRSAVVRRLQAEVAAVLGQRQGPLPDPALGFFEMGLDSLMAVELRNRLVRLSGVQLSAAGIFEHPTIHALAGHLAAQLWPAPEAPAVPATATPGLPPDGDAIAAELAAIDALLGERRTTPDTTP